MSLKNGFRIGPLVVQTVYGADGEHETPYLTRLVLGRLRLHIFHRGDADPDPHCHPWEFWTFPLTPYFEDVYTVVGPFAAYRRQLVRAWRVHYRSHSHTHRVVGRAGRPKGVTVDNHWRVVRGKVVTLVWTGQRGPNDGWWGFLKYRDGRWCWQHWRDYVFNGGKHAPCEDYSEVDPAALEDLRARAALHLGAETDAWEIIDSVEHPREG